MRILINGVVYDSTEKPVLIVLDKNERKMFNDVKRILFAPEETSKDEQRELLNASVNCPHDNITRWNHGYHSECEDCGEMEV